MLIKPITPLLKIKEDPTLMSFLGTVEDNNDPEKLGRVRVRISPYIDLLTDALPWASPLLGSSGNSSTSGGLNIPEIGSQVRITFPSRDMTAPYYSGAELTENNKVTLFDEDYPDTYGYKDSNGNFIKINKVKGTTLIQHESSANISISANGSMELTMRDGYSMALNNQGTFVVKGGGFSITGTPDGCLTLKCDSELKFEATKITLDAPITDIKGGAGADSGANGHIWALNGLVEVTDGLITSIGENS